ncbi:MAG: GNAT family N-acetyltransferase [Bacteroidia bacterium]|nr:GNAT family N-acetyltransferase [Bacteroidia bacterium]
MTKIIYNSEFLSQLTFEPLSRENWTKFVQLFGPRGACGHCWCMYYRLSKPEYHEGKADDGNKEAMQNLVMNNNPTGILGFYDGIPIAWCAFAPREHFIKLEKSRVHKRIDDQEVWSIPCFFVAKEYRRQGVTVELLKAVISYAKAKGIKIIEAYPTIPTKETLPDSFAWIGLYKSFERAGFVIADRTSKNRPMVRYYTDKI